MSEQEETPAPVPGTTKAKGEKDWTFAHSRLLPIGWTEDDNRLPMAHVRPDGTRPLHMYPLFDADEQGNLVINYFEPDGSRAEYTKGENKWGTPYSVTRLQSPIADAKGKVRKYKAPAGTGTRAWFGPRLIEAYQNEKEVDTIIMQEGVLKSYAGDRIGLYTLGYSGILNTRDKQTMTLHASVINVLKKLKPKNVVWMQDGDCRDLTQGWPDDPEKDLYSRPNDFYNSATMIGTLLQDYAKMIGFRTWFMHPVSDAIPVRRGDPAPKALDDIIVAYPYGHVEAHEDKVVRDANGQVVMGEERVRYLHEEAISTILKDCTEFGHPPTLFERRDLSRPTKLREYFNLRSVEQFYAHYQERIGEKEFVYDGTKYQWNESDKSLTVKVPSVAKRYVRVGTDHFKYVKIRNPHSNQLEEYLKPWKRTTIVEDHGKHFPGHVMKLEAFTNYPSHVSYQEIIDNCMNSYGRFMHTPDPEGEPPETTLKFMRHIWGSGEVCAPHPKKTNPDGTPVMMKVKELDLGLDYMKLLYEQPTQMLPIVCLVSKQRETGKSTFFHYLQHLFTSNATEISAKDLEGDFNSHYASKLVVIIDEALVSKQESVEKLKHLSTTKNIQVNTKGIAQYPQAFFGKFLMGSNNIRNFIKTDDDEIRFWVRDIPEVTEKDPKMMDTLVDEIPAFLHYLQQRPFATEMLSRAWFHPSLLVTEALRQVRKHSTNHVKQAITGWVRGIFWGKANLETILMTAKDLKKEVFPNNSRVDVEYIKQVLKEEMDLHTFRDKAGKPATTPYSYWRIIEKRDTASGAPEVDFQEVKMRVSDRPFVIAREAFISKEEESEVMRELVAPEMEKKNGAVPQMAGDPDDDLPF